MRARNIRVTATTLAIVLLALFGGLTVVSTPVAADEPDPSNITFEEAGTENDPFHVGTLDELHAIRKNNSTSAHYEFVSDIDASETKNWNNGKGWKPITETYQRTTEGGFEVTGYASTFGDFYGNGHEITGLYINRSSDDQALLGNLNDNSTIQNLTLTDVNITASGSEVTAGLVAHNSGQVRNVEVEGRVKSKQVQGLVVGRNVAGSVTESSSQGTVIGTKTDGFDGSKTGGLVGEQNAPATISQSYSTASVSGTDSVGGLVGWATEANIDNSYATGDVTGNSSVGGLVGISGDHINDSYATGDVTGNSTSDAVGGLVGKVSIAADGTAGVDSYWDVDATGQSTSAGNATGLTTAEMQGQAAKTNMSAFDFNSTWEVAEGQYPTLQVFDLLPDTSNTDDSSTDDGSVTVEPDDDITTISPIPILVGLGVPTLLVVGLVGGGLVMLRRRS